MTSRRSHPRRSNGSDAARTAALALTALLAAAPCPARVAWAEPGSAWRSPSRGGAGTLSGSPNLIDSSGGVTIDWAAGTLRASGGAAADLRMPSVDLARPGALRRAHAAAAAKLRAALDALPLGGTTHLAVAEIERAISRARDVDVQYQSDGGAVVVTEVRFGDWLQATPDASAAPVALSVAAMHLGAAPPFKIGKHEGRIGAATYAHGSAPRAANPHAARLDHAGRLSLEGPADLVEKLAQGRVVIYVEKVQR